MIKAALIGNPNCGKTTLFNKITGSKAHVGNWPGVTVEKKEGTYKFKDNIINIIDLPGIYSLSPYSPEEIVTKNFILDENIDIIINIVDITNLERNLYLTSQLMEIDCPIVIALNMIDIFQKQNCSIDIKALEKKLSIPIIPISATKNKGIEDLIKCIVETSKQTRNATTILEDSSLFKYIDEINNILKKQNIDNSLFHSIKILENDSINYNIKDNNKVISNEINNIYNNVVKIYNNSEIEAIIADIRYKYIIKHYSSLIKTPKDEKTNFSQKIDLILTNKFLGIPIFLFIMYMMFHISFSENFLFVKDLPSPGVFLKEIVEGYEEPLSEITSNFLSKINASDWQIGLVSNGLLVGMISIFSFLPQILLIFLFLSILEDSGYMARACFLMDKSLKSIGLSGKSFVPLIMGFGCSVPAAISTRTSEKEKERLLTIMLIPFMSCTAKLPIYTIFVSAFFPHNGDLVIFLLYILGVVIAIGIALILNNTIFKDNKSNFIMEMPSYKMPSLQTISINIYEKLKSFINKAGTILVTSIIIIWFLSNFDFSLKLLDEPNSSNSILGIISNKIKFIFSPLGFIIGEESWKLVASILTGIIAKEAVITTLGQLYIPGFDEDTTTTQAFSAALSSTINSSAAVSFMVFNLLTLPCIAALCTISKEINSKKYFWFYMFLQVVTSWIITYIIYNIVKIFI